MGKHRSTYAAMIATFLMLVVCCSEQALAQADRVEIPGRDSASTRPDLRKTERPPVNSPEFIRQEFKKYKDVAAPLRATSINKLRDEYYTRKAQNPKLTPGQFFAAKMIVQVVSTDYPGRQVSEADLFEGLKEDRSYRSTLIEKGGLTSEQAKDVQTKTAQRLKAIQRR
ncbi:MAG: hypothetical protein ACLGJB_08825 [Blastocatellia bacterium]